MSPTAPHDDHRPRKSGVRGKITLKEIARQRKRDTGGKWGKGRERKREEKEEKERDSQTDKQTNKHKHTNRHTHATEKES